MISFEEALKKVQDEDKYRQDVENIEQYISQHDFEQETEDKQHAFMYDTTIGWAKDYINNASKLSQKAGEDYTKLALGNQKLVSADMFDELGNLQVLSDDEKYAKAFSEDAYQMRQQIFKPLAMMATLTPVGWWGFAATIPFMIDEIAHNAETQGYGTAIAETAKSFIPGVNTYKYWSSDNPEVVKYREEHPGRAFMSTVAMDTAVVSHPSLSLVSKAQKLKIGESVQRVKETLKSKLQADGKQTGIVDGQLPTPAMADKATPIKAQKIIEDTPVMESRESHGNRGAFMENIGHQPSKLDGTVTVEQIYETANKVAPSVRIGRLTTRRAYGYFEPNETGIRIKGVDAWDVVAHEIGHYIDMELSKITKSPEMKKELVAAHESFFGDMYKPSERPSEGIALFTTEYAINPIKAQKDFPLYYKAFEDWLNTKADVKFRDNFNLMCEQIRLWYDQNAAARIRGNIHFEDDTTKAPLKEQASEAIVKVNNAIIDDTAQLRSTVDTALKQMGKTIKPSDHPADIALAAKSTAPARAQMLLGFDVPLSSSAIFKELGDVFGIKFKNNVTFSDMYSPITSLYEYGKVQIRDAKGRWKKPQDIKNYCKSIGCKDLHEAFSTFVTILHTKEIREVKNKALIEKLGKYVDERKLKDIETGKSGYKTAFAVEDMDLALKRLFPPQFFQAAEKLKMYNENMMDIMVHYGFVSKDSAAWFLENYPYYVPEKRSFAIEGNLGKDNISTSQHYANVAGVIQKLSDTGSERTIVDPLTNLARMTINVIQRGERNEVAKAIANIANSKHGSVLAQKVSGSTSNSAMRIFTVWKDGKQQAYQAIAPGIYEAVMEMDKGTAGVVTNMADNIVKGMANTLRFTATATPAFTVANLCRDILTACCFTKDGTKIPVPIFDAAMRIYEGFAKRADEALMAKFYAQGVPFSTFIGSNKNISNTLRDIGKPLPNNAYVKAWGQVKGVFDNMLEFNRKVEEAPRLAEFERCLKKGMSPFEAGAAARDITVNFARSGSAGKVVNRYIPFFNATLQGTNKLYREITQNPVRLGMYAGTYITMPSLALWYYNHDKDWYKELSLNDKMRYWFIGNADGSTIIRIPKPETLGMLFGSVPERIMDMVVDGDRGITMETLKIIAEQSTPGLLPTAVLPMIEWKANYNFFKDRAIVSPRDQKKQTQDQYNIYTSEIAKGLGRLMGASPLKIDNTIYAYFSSMGGAVLGLTDFAAEKIGLRENQTPSRKITEWSRFTTNAQRSRSRTSTEFYNGRDKLEQDYNSATDRRERAKIKRNLNAMNSAYKAVSELRSQKTDIMNNKKLSGDQKRERLDKIDNKINSIQRKANAKYLGITYFNRD